MRARSPRVLPLFSTFVRRLRAKGHNARVVVRSVDAAEGDGFPEWIEIRVHLHGGSHHNPEYRATGHVRTSFVYGRWQLDVRPRPGDSRARYAPQIPAPKIEQMSKEELESQVIAMLERLAPHEHTDRAL